MISISTYPEELEGYKLPTGMWIAAPDVLLPEGTHLGTSTPMQGKKRRHYAWRKLRKSKISFELGLKWDSGWRVDEHELGSAFLVRASVWCSPRTGLIKAS